MLNIVSPNDPWVPLVNTLKWLVATDLYGTAGTTGFSQEYPRLFADKVNIYDHCNMLKIDVFETKVIPFLNMSRGFENLGLEYVSDKAWKKFYKENEH